MALIAHYALIETVEGVTLVNEPEGHMRGATPVELAALEEIESLRQQLRGAVEEKERLRKAILRVIADGSANVEADELLRAAVGVPPDRGQ